MDRYKIYNARVITPYRIIENGCVLVEDGEIKYVGKENVSSEGFEEIDAGGKFVAPGFIDLHTHGAGGHDFMDGTLEAYLVSAETHARYGTTSLLPTTLTSTNEELKVTFDIFKKAKAANKKGANLLGLHLEGPYFSMEQKGAQDPKYIRNPDPAEYMQILSWSDDIMRWSAAPELPGIDEFGKCIRKAGILPTIAHTDAVLEDVQKAMENGFTHCTHLYSAMSGLKRINGYRYLGVIESAFLLDDMTVEIIADGSHLPPSLLKLIYKIKGPSKIALVTDSMRGAGMPEGESILGSLENGQKVYIEDGVAKMPDRKAFAGSVATADRLVRNMIKLVDVPLTEAVRMMTLTPATIIGVSDKKGSLEAGKDADLVMFDGDINIFMTMVGGKKVYEKN